MPQANSIPRFLRHAARRLTQPFGEFQQDIELDTLRLAEQLDAADIAALDAGETTPRTRRVQMRLRALESLAGQ